MAKCDVCKRKFPTTSVQPYCSDCINDIEHSMCINDLAICNECLDHFGDVRSNYGG